jgi:hypothetical protein
MNTGFICEWNFNDKVGRIVGCTGESGVYPFEWDQCTDPLKVHLAQNRIIHTNGPCPGPTDATQVKFELLGGEARNVDLA